MSIFQDIPVLGFAAFSGTGKTTLLKQLIPLLRARGLNLGLVKHSHHPAQMDRPGKDSWLLRRAGADQVLIASRQRTVVIDARGYDGTVGDPGRLISRLGDDLDLILVEGFKHYPFPKIEVHRPVLGYPLLCRDDHRIIAVASDAPLALPGKLPLLAIDDIRGIADFICNGFLHQARQPDSKASSNGPSRA